VGGIIGKLSFAPDQTLARPVLEQMLGTLRHRGTVGSDIHVAPGIALGWCGDASPPVDRPAVSANSDLTVRVVADATLTNAVEVREDLERHGHVLRGRTDADLIAHAYDEWGDECLERLRGPFACAIWDEPRQRLVLARDAIGIRPLFFAMLHGHGLVFASEVRALLQDPGVSREWCPQAIDAYLALGYVPAPLTVYQRVSKVEPAQCLVVEGRRLHVRQYWDLPVNMEREIDQATVDALDAHLRAALRTAPDKESTPGVLYSGGAASAAILATHPRRQITVVTVAMDHDAGDVARRDNAATHLGFNPVVEVAAPDVIAMAQHLAAHFDEPLGDPSAILQYSTCLAARLHMTIAVAGHGASTLWSDRAAATNERFDQHPQPMWDIQHRRGLYTRAFAWEVRQANPFAKYLDLEASDRRHLDGAKYAALRTSLPDNTLAVAERASSAAGLQLRFPFLERELVELAASTPVRGSRDRFADPLRLLLARSLPYRLLPPLDRGGPRYPWLSGALAAIVPGILLGRRFDSRGIVSRLALQRLWDDHSAGRRDHSYRFWSLLMLEFWFREFIDGDAVDEPIEYAILKAA
jgi:asparagine synthase (glutamine-hydrolysing)